MRIIERRVPLEEMLQTEPLTGVAFTGEAGGHQFVITALRSKEPVALTGSVSGMFIGPDGAGIELDDAEIDSQGRAAVTLKQACYGQRGPFGIRIFHGESGGKLTVIYSAAGFMDVGEPDTVYDPGNTINVAAIEAKIAEMDAATAAANTASAFVPNIIAPDYTSLTFPIPAGTYCTHSGNYYISKAEIASSEAWTAAHWTQITVGSEASGVSATDLSILDQINQANDTIDYGYEVDGSVGSSIKFRRRKTALMANGTVSTSAGSLYVKMTDAFGLATNGTQVKAWDTGLQLTEGKRYRAKYRLIGGTVVNTSTATDLPTLSVYPLGENTSIGTFNRISNTECERVFTAPAGKINIALFARNATVFTDAVYSITLEIVPEEAAYISPKTVGLYGDSICRGVITSGVYATKNFTEYIGDILGYGATNNAVGGSGYCKRSDMPSLYDAVVSEGAAFGSIVLFAGTNDYGYNKSIGTISDIPSNTTSSTFYASVKNLIEYIYEQNENCQIMIITPIFRNYHASGGTGNTYTTITNTAGYTLGDFCDALVAIGEYYNIPVLDMRKNSPVNLLNYADKLTETDSGTGKYLHPTDSTYPVLYKKLVKWMNTII